MSQMDRSIESITNREQLSAAIGAGFVPSFLFFWGHTAKEGRLGKQVLSQWWPAPFVVEGQRYATAEHFMMAEKAKLFADHGTFSEILRSDDPKQAKALGRSVRNFEPAAWDNRKFEVAIEGNLAKFGQNHELRDWLMGTANDVLVEASPVDRVWGIGLSEDDKRATDVSKWRGDNLLGFALMKVRSELAGLI
jgi:ribA/ribD-fused uncharacterized protein